VCIDGVKKHVWAAIKPHAAGHVCSWKKEEEQEEQEEQEEEEEEEEGWLVKYYGPIISWDWERRVSQCRVSANLSSRVDSRTLFFSRACCCRMSRRMSNMRSEQNVVFKSIVRHFVKASVLCNWAYGGCFVWLFAHDEMRKQLFHSRKNSWQTVRRGVTDHIRHDREHHRGSTPRRVCPAIYTYRHPWPLTSDRIRNNSQTTLQGKQVKNPWGENRGGSLSRMDRCNRCHVTRRTD